MSDGWQSFWKWKKTVFWFELVDLEGKRSQRGCQEQVKEVDPKKEKSHQKTEGRAGKYTHLFKRECLIPDIVRSGHDSDTPFEDTSCAFAHWPSWSEKSSVVTKAKLRLQKGSVWMGGKQVKTGRTAIPWKVKEEERIWFFKDLCWRNMAQSSSSR